MYLLVLNLGSTSFKYAIFEEKNLTEIARGNFKMQTSSQNIQAEVDKHFREVLREVGDISQIKTIGHRVVHGGDQFLDSQRIEAGDLPQLEALNSLAPLHNPFNIAGIRSAMEYLPTASNFTIFDTAFYKDLPDYAKLYAIPYEFYEKFGIHKFGFHGISHKFVVNQVAIQLKKPLDKINIISVHLGGGCSVTAVAAGQAVDTSMGFTPMEGLMMSTRSGDIDPGVILKMMDLLEEDESSSKQEKLNKILNHNSGIYGISGHRNYLDLLKAVNDGEPKSVLAFNMFIWRIKKYIGAYAAILGDVDAIILTGQIGAGNPMTKKKICDKLNILKHIPILVITTNEELAIAQETKALI